jgi:hypothetical protein
MQQIISDWNGRSVAIAISRRGVRATIDPYDNMIRTGVAPWPPPEVVQKAYGSEAIHAFAPEDADALTSRLNHYSDLQSLHSEDAVTWSAFGPIVYAPKTTQRAFAMQLLALLRIEPVSGADPRWWLWRRIPHPDKPVSGGPEVDLGLQLGDLTVFGEAKWGSDVGTGQGVSGTKDQITLRREWCESLGRRVYDSGQRFVVLGISRSGDMLAGRRAECATASVGYADISWEMLASLSAHPLRDEFKRYLAWKNQHTRETPGERRRRERGIGHPVAGNGPS